MRFCLCREAEVFYFPFILLFPSIISYFTCCFLYNNIAILNAVKDLLNHTSRIAGRRRCFAMLNMTS
jgi:hypothetical protein